MVINVNGSPIIRLWLFVANSVRIHNSNGRNAGLIM